MRQAAAKATRPYRQEKDRLITHVSEFKKAMLAGSSLDRTGLHALQPKGKLIELQCLDKEALH
ncbi:hypothetical protein, partial [Halochromatium roseum]|uniref:hypothetical protein n=1 Tax=Halochromatium roseum TaxID=391920 RepID=UPI001A92A322